MYFTLISILIIIDQAIKWISRTKLTKFESYPVIDGFFHFTYVENRGAAFGMLQNKTWFFVLITLVVVGYMIYFTKKNKNIDKKLTFVLSIITAGAIGNLIDRIWLGFVVDMFDFRGIWQFVFNFADICVVVGGILLIFLIIKDKEILEKI
ncbi:MAG: signal peptidase II [Acetoanaerobium sp.]|jgi:signal peptidase II|uniref:Lipoprotein signal peptidase n=1 Tax=Acetoanaerobium sticklandii (strain ATCC 12662 / DSM 519 / JCM 1433 / CCUG 9281 / NCIMB 10654 / HF) TaxID=499177 RepID=E3PSY7_ACESD|nr:MULTISPECIES: signal peptidase II [Acetoanaerobium]MBP8763207.1 signal peptidase II [Acetoanaerobium sp.]MBP9499589.1 signal peptidase II [Acetoanaerobium sp.]CBH21991.1 prolipoprotein signal peptidase (signal peptidase II) [Acetoanaerobium sticklandii]